MKTKNENSELPAMLIRLDEFISAMHLTVHQVNKKAGLCKGLLRNAFTKKQGLTTSSLEAILLAYPQLNANWLLVGRGEMLNESDSEKASHPSSTEQHLQHLNELQEQCVSMIKTIQQMKQQEQADEDAKLIDQLMR